MSKRLPKEIAVTVSLSERQQRRLKQIRTIMKERAEREMLSANWLFDPRRTGMAARRLGPQATE